MELMKLWGFVAGLGIFIYSMGKLENTLKKLAGNSFKTFLKKHTSNPIKAILSGTATTAILQSSSIVTLMLLALVGSGLLDLRNALGVILGSNLGTTFTGWIVTYLGFKVSFSEMVLPLLALGSLGQAFIPKPKRWHYASKLIFYIALLFWGLDTMKASVEQLSQYADVSLLQGYHPLIYMLVAFLFTGVIQSSSATMMITLSALNSELIPFTGAAAMVIGADLGTTITAIFGALRGSANSKRVALAHFTYNLVVDLLALAAIIPLVDLVRSISPDDPLTSLVLFHSSFNLLGIILFVPFLGYFAKFLESRFTDQEKDSLNIVSEIPLSESQEFLDALKTESQSFQKQVLNLLEQSFQRNPTWKVYSREMPDFISAYNRLKEVEGELLQHIISYQQRIKESSSALEVHDLVTKLRLQGIVLKTLKDVIHNLEGFASSDANFVVKIYKQYQIIFKKLVGDLAASNVSTSNDQASNYQSEINNILQFIYQSANNTGISEIEYVSLLNMNHELASIIKILEGSR